MKKKEKKEKKIQNEKNSQNNENLTDKQEKNSKNENSEKAENEKSEKAENEKEEETYEKNEISDKDETIESLGKKLDEMNDKYLRLSAEYDNYRRRTLKEKMELTKTANEKLLVDILPVIDNLERALISIQETDDIKALEEGVSLIYNNFKDFIKKQGVKEIEAKELPLDTDFHEAITKIPAPNDELKGKIVDVVEKGYTLNDKVIRFAKVVIGE